jgi:hypothetical protein
MQQLVSDIWRSYRALPGWVQIWVAGILVPVNSASIFFVGQPNGWLLASLAIGAMLPNLYFIIVERGFSKAMALSHLLIWVPLVVWLFVWLPAEAPAGGFGLYLWLLLGVDVISLAFDIPDGWRWWRGDRDIARP